jgi:hypothetical protein
VALITFLILVVLILAMKIGGRVAMDMRVNNV